MTEPSKLTAFQVEVARVFFSLPASAGFVLAGGAALLANDLTERPTQDLDFFHAAPDVPRARDELEAAAAQRQWTVTRVRDHEAFVRLEIQGDDTVVVDLCLDSPPIRPPVVTRVGPTFAPEELAARKVVALFDRAEARDFADLYALLQRYSKRQLLELAAELDTGFSTSVFAGMLRSVARHGDAELSEGGADADEVRAVCLTWASELEGSGRIA